MKKQNSYDWEAHTCLCYSASLAYLLWLLHPLYTCPTSFSVCVNLLSFWWNMLVYHYDMRAISFRWLKLVSYWLLDTGQRSWIGFWIFSEQVFVVGVVNIRKMKTTFWDTLRVFSYVCCSNCALIWGHLYLIDFMLSWVFVSLCASYVITKNPSHLTTLKTDAFNKQRA